MCEWPSVHGALHNATCSIQRAALQDARTWHCTQSQPVRFCGPIGFSGICRVAALAREGYLAQTPACEG